MIHSATERISTEEGGSRRFRSPPTPPPAQSKCYDPYRHLIVSVRDQQRCPLTTPAGKNYLGIDQECNSQGYEGYKVSVNYVYNVIGLLLC